MINYKLRINSNRTCESDLRTLSEKNNAEIMSFTNI